MLRNFDFGICGIIEMDTLTTCLSACLEDQ